MNRPHPLKIVFGIVATILAFSVIFSFVSYLMSIVYGLSGVRLPDFPRRIIDTVVGFILAYAVFALTSLALRKMRPRRQAIVFGPIIESLERIASGDFSVRIGDTLGKHEKEVYGDLVASVNKMAKDLGEMEKMRREFVSDVSHEIQSPLTSILGFAKALKSDTIDPGQRNHYLSIIETECTRLSRTADNLLKLASLESEALTLAPKRFRLDTQIRNIVINCESQWRGKHIGLEAALDETEIVADEDLLSQVWLNLIANSIKFTPFGGSIGLSLKTREKVIEFLINDSGIGIRHEDQPRIFERFFKSDPSRQRTNEGSGLGLSIVKKIVEINKGRVYVSSEPGQGSTFCVILPAAR